MVFNVQDFENNIIYCLGVKYRKTNLGKTVTSYSCLLPVQYGRRVMFLYKVTFPITGLAYIIMSFLLFLQIRAYRDNFDNVHMYAKLFKNANKKLFSL